MKDEILSPFSWLENNRQSILEQLKEFVRIPSVSFAGYASEHVRQSADYTQDLLIQAGLEQVQLLELDECHPYVFGQWCHAPDKPTLLLYAHHDVQPPMRESLWHSPPFEPVEREGRLFGRGSADDKAGVVVHAASIAAFMQTSGRLPLNIKVLIEGEEEIGSPHLARFIEKYQDLLASDGMVLTDLSNFDTGIPTLTTSLRGMVCAELEIKTLKKPLHSGMWGGPLPDANMALAKILAGLANDQGRLAIPGISPSPNLHSQSTLESLENLPYNSQIFAEQSGLLPGTTLLREGADVYASLWLEPSLVINAMESGGRKRAGNVLMDSAWCRLGIRIVPGMDPEKVFQALSNQVHKLAPWGVQVNLTPDALVPAWSTETDHPLFDEALAALKEGYGREPVLCGCGATIPFTGPLSEGLGNIPALLVGIEDPYTHAHSENESLDLSDFFKAILSQIHLFNRLEKYPATMTINR